jgi:hypothetical protein
LLSALFPPSLSLSAFQEQDDAFLYVALERCRCSIADLVLGEATLPGLWEDSAEKEEAAAKREDEKHNEKKTMQTRSLNTTSATSSSSSSSSFSSSSSSSFSHSPRFSAPLRSLLYQMLDGISHLHSHRIFHRDVKPQNILINHENV